MLTPEQIRSFHDNGYLIVRSLLPARDLEALRGVADRLQESAVAKLRDPGYLGTAMHLNKDWIEHQRDHFVYRQKPDGAYAFHRVERGFTQDPLMRQVCMSQRLLSAAWSLLGRPFWPRAGNIVYKLPHEGAAVRWHQDIPYLYWSTGGHTNQGRPTTHAIPNFTTDVYLDDSTEANGCLYAVPGTHKNGTVDVDRWVADGSNGMPKGAVPLELKAGDVMFHHVAVVHGSPENKSAVRRRTVYYHYLANETVQDAYSDWPDLLSPAECREFWGGALRERRAATPEEAAASPRFELTPDGLAAA